MKFNRNEHSRFVQCLDRIAERNPLLWLPCILLLVIAMGAEQICGTVRVAFPYREKACVDSGKTNVQLVRKPFAMRVVAMTLVLSFGFMAVPELNGIIGIDVFADDISELTLGESGSNATFEMYGLSTVEYFSIYNAKLCDVLIQNTGTTNYSFDLFDLDADGIPELFISNGNYVQIFTVDSNELIDLNDPYSGYGGYYGVVEIINNQYMLSYHFNHGIEALGYYQKVGNKLVSCFSAYSDAAAVGGEIAVNEINGKIVSREEYEAVLSDFDSQLEGSERESIGRKYQLDENTINNVFPTNKRGKCGDNAYWELSSEGVLTVTGTGAIYDYKFNVDDFNSNEPWQNSTVKKAVINDGITRIGNDFLMYCTNVETIILPQSLVEIGAGAFCYTNIKGINLPNGIIKMENYVFEGCQKLEEVTLPSNLAELSDGLFNYCSVKKVILPNSLRNIGSSFSHCAIEYLDIPDSVTYIESGAFFRCSIKEITIPNGVSSIESATFEDCWELEKIIIPSTVININNNAFIGCQNLTIYGYSGSTAETYAKDNGINFIAINRTDCEVSFVPEASSVLVGSTVEITANVSNSPLADKKFIIEDTSIAEIESFNKELNENPSDDFFFEVYNLKIKGLKEGTTRLSLYEQDNFIGSCEINVYAQGSKDPLVGTPDYEYINDGKSFYVHALKTVDGNLIPINNATVTVKAVKTLDGNSATDLTGVTNSNGICIFQNIDGYNYWITVSAAGYTSKTVPIQLNPNERNQHSYVRGQSYINYGKGFSVVLSPQTYTPKVVKASFVDTNGEYDILTHDKTIFIDDTNNESCSFNIGTQLYGTTHATISLTQNGKTIATRELNANDDGYAECSFSDFWKRNLERYEDIDIVINSGKHTTTVKSHLICNNQLFKGKNEVEKFELSWCKGNGKFQIPSERNIVGFSGMNVSLDLPDIPVEFIVSEEDNTVFLSIGYEAYNSNKESKVTYMERITRDWESTLNTYNYGTRNAFEGKFIQRTLSNSVKSTFNFKGCGKGHIDKNGNVVINLDFLMSYDVKGEYSQQYVIGVVPVYLKVGMTAGAKYKPGIKIDFNITDFGNTINVKPTCGTLTMKIGASLHGGVGIAKVLSVGGSIDGTLTLTTEFDTLHQMIEARAGAYLEAQALIFKWTMPIAEQTWPIYDNKNKVAYTNQQDYSMSSKLYSGSFTEISRDYNTEDFSLGTMIYSKQSSIGSYSNSDSQEIAANVYPDAQSKVVTINGVQYLFRLADNGARTSLNRTALVCSVKNGENWDKPFIISDDTTGDYYFDVCADNDDIYIAWTNCSKSFENSASIEDVTASTNITIAVLNTLTGKIKELGTVGSSMTGDYLPAISVADGKGIVAWLSNSDNNIMQTSGTNTVCYSKINGNTVSQPVEYFSSNNLITSVDTGIIGGRYAIAFSGDTDGDVSTLDDTEIFASYIDSIPKKITDNSDVDSQVQFVKSNDRGYLFWYENGNIAYADSLNGQYSKAFDNERLMTDDFTVIDGSNVKVIWINRQTADDSDKSSILVSDFNGIFNEPSICDIADGEFTDITAYSDANGNINYIASSIQSGSINIYDNKEHEIREIKFEGIYVDYDKGYSGEKMPVTLSIANKGNVTVNDLAVTVKSANNSESIVLQNMNLKAQTSDNYTFEINVPALFEEMNFTVYADGFDTSVDFELGYTDLAISASKFFEEDSTYADVCITNESEISSGAKLNVYVDGEMSYTYDINSIAPCGMAAMVFDIDSISSSYEEITFEVVPVKSEVFKYNNKSILYGTKSTESDTYRITIPKNVTVYRNNTVLIDNAVIYKNDILTITADTPIGFKLKSLNVNGKSIPSGETYTVGNEDVIINVEFEHIHEVDIEYSANKSGHWHTCSKCDEKVDYAMHTEDNGTVTREATEITNGLITYKCYVCGYIMRTEPIHPDHTHSFGSNWKSDSTSHWHECSCGVKSDTAYHTENSGIVTVQPTSTSTGTKTYSCTVCGYVTRTEPIPVNPPINPTPVNPTPPNPAPISPVPGTEVLPPVLTINKSIDISISSDLADLAKGEVRIHTKRRFFENSAEVRLTNTADSETAGKKAMSRRDNDSLICYPFDISVYNADTGSKMQLVQNGYITFEIPVPKSMEANAVSIEVYHIPGGVPEYIESEVTTDEYGNLKVVFTANEFSPYMFTAVSGEDIASGAGASANAVSVDFASPVSNGVTIPTAKLPRMMGYSRKKRRYRILRKRRLDDLAFVF